MVVFPDRKRIIAGIREVLVPARNERDLDDIPKDIRGELKVHLVKRVDEVLSLVLEPPLATPPRKRSRSTGGCGRPTRTCTPAGWPTR